MKKFRLYAAFAILPIALGIWAMFLLSFNPNAVFNSDTVHLFLLAEEIISKPIYFNSWYLPGSNFIFPDVILATAVAATHIAPVWMPIAISAVQSPALILVIALLSSRAGKYTFDNALWIAAALFIVVTMTSILNPLVYGGQMTMLLVTPYIRIGTIVSGVFVLATLASSKASSRFGVSRPSLLVALLAGYSDPFFILWFALPCLGATALIGVRTGRWQLILPAASLTAIAVLGIAFDKITRSAPPEVPQLLAFSARQGVAVFYHAVTAGDLYTIVALALTTLMCLRAAYLLARRKVNNPQIVEILLAACCICSVIAPIATGISWAPAHLRYSMPIFILPYVWSMLVIPRIPLWAAVSVLLISLIPAIYASNFSYNKLLQPRELATCLMEKGLRDGYSDYWNSKETIFLSGRVLHIPQLFENGSPRLINTSRRWFSERSDGEKFAPTFVLPKGLKADSLIERFGRPSSVGQCDGQDVWVYAKLPLATADLSAFR